ncbi:MAG TPA: sigma-70 family RNA polymerase sigma factor [Streptosporangiaceae bacterium]|nr:sigma-70 family RNA polymerase sigma factor [Streptosporangiaceae bacterium]
MGVQGDFEEFYQANYGRTVAMAAAVLGSRSEAEDVAQEAFTRALARWSRLSCYDVPEAWVRQVALRLAIDSGRRMRRAIKVAVKMAAQRHPPQPEAADSLAFTALGDALKRLPLQQRQLVALYYLTDMSVADIARESGVALGTVKARLASARQHIERELTEQTGVISDAR